MSVFKRLRSQLRTVFRRAAFDAEMAEEMRLHLERRTQANIAAGMSDEEARYAAKRQFGGVDQLKEIAREQRSTRWVEDTARNARFAIRQLRKNPGFTATALLTLALCLGANLTIFAVVDAILLRPLPFPESERLVTVVNSYPAAGVERSGASVVNYFERREAIKALSSVSLFADDSVTVGEKGSPNRVPIARVTPEFFSTLGVRLAMGRSFTDEELVYGPDGVAVLTDAFWRTHFHADPAVIGKIFLNDGLAVRVVGVLPRGFRFLSSRAQIFRPAAHLAQAREPQNRHSNNYSMIARLAPGRALAEAQAQLDALNAALLPGDLFAAEIGKSGYRAHLLPLHADHVRDVRPTLVLLQSGVLFLLIIGTVNLANLFLIRASSRTREFAVRQALGAGKWHLAREVLSETLLLALGGGLIGLLLGAAGIKTMAVLGVDRLPLGASVVFDARVAAVSFAAAIVVGLLLAVPVIWFTLRARLAPGLQLESRGGTASPAAQRVRHGFVVAQLALALVLLAGASLLGLSLRRVLASPTGFRPDNVLTGRIALPWKNYQDGRARLAFVERLIPAIRALPGVSHAAISSDPPLMDGGANVAVTVEGHASRAGGAVHPHYQSGVTSDYWAALGIALRQGRLLEDADNQRAERVCVVDEDFANRYWPEGNAPGHRIASGLTLDDKTALTVVGVVSSVRQIKLGEARGHGMVYFPYALFDPAGFSLVVRASLPPASLVPAIRKAILEIDPELPLDDVRSMEARINDSVVTFRSPALLAGFFAVVALLLAAIGTYGVLAYAVGQRRREIGVRMALGALPGQIGRQFLALGLRLLVAGVALGLLGAYLAGRGMQSLLFEVPPFPVATLAGISALMAVITLTACLLPARRAAKVDPMVALRAE